jgi:long-chain acyl-CoA synthetase
MSPGPDGAAVAGSFWQRAERDPGHVALIDGEGREHRAAELLAAANRLAHGLTAAGLHPGDRVAAVLANEPAMVRLYLAVAQAGMYLLTINYHLTASEIAYILEDSGAKIVVTSQRASTVALAAADAAGLRADRVFAAQPAGSIDGLEAGMSDSYPRRRPAGGVMQYTSGTTGRPKGVLRPLPVAGADAAYERNRYSWIFDETGLGDVFSRWLAAAPLYHSANLMPATAALHAGGLLVLMDGWSPESFLEAVERHAITGTHLVPTHFHRLLALPQATRQRHDVSSLRFVLHGASPCPVHTKRKMLDWLGPVLYEYYGSTEVGSTFATPQEWTAHPGTVGRALSRLTLKVLDAGGDEVGPGEIGTVYMRQEGDETIYLNDPAKTAAAREGELITVGDLGYLDEDGFLFLTGRAAEMIIVGGVNVYPAEIEAVLSEHPAVEDVGVIGVPDEDLGEVPVAYLQLDGTPETDVRSELEALCLRKLARHKHPQALIVVDALPRDPTGKLRKRLLRGGDGLGAGRSDQMR